MKFFLLAFALITPMLLSASAQASDLDQNTDFSSLRAPAELLAQAAEPVATARNCKRPRGRFLFNVEQTDIRSLLKKIARITCKNFIVSEGVKGKSDITIISHKKVNVDQAYSAFLAALEANNMALVRAGRFYKVVERKSATNLPLYEKGSDLPWTDAQVTLLHQLNYAALDQVQGLVKGLLTKSGEVEELGGNMLLITDSAANIRRVMKILDKVDVAGSSSRMHIVDINWADASEISTKLTEIFKDTTTKSGKGGGEDVSIDKMIADERTNKLIIICSESAFESVKEVIDILDTPDGDRSSGTQIFVHKLNNADATKLASTLTSLTSGASKTSSKAKGGKSASKAQKAAELFEGEVKITADEATNGLVIVSSARDFRSLMNIIEDLDIRRPQVYVEAAIMEVAINENRRVSLDAYAGLPTDVPGYADPGLGIIANEGGQSLITSSAQALAARQVFNSLSENAAASGATAISSAADAASSFESLLGAFAFQGPAVPGSDELFGFPVPSFGVVLNALQANANVNVLSTPHLMTTDNEKAEISVGERVPVVRGISPVGAGALGAGLQQVAYEDVKLKFVVTPHVNDSGEIRLEIEQEVSDIGGNIPVGNGLEQPIITNRSLQTTVVVRDQQSVVLGGLISNRNTDSESKIPFLGDIPLIGWLFKNWSDTNSRTNLILVLTPYIVRSDEDMQRIYTRKIVERQQFVEAFYGAATDYDPYIDYTKKTGPLGKLLTSIDTEAQKLENGGPGAPGEEPISPDLEAVPFEEEAMSAEPEAAVSDDVEDAQ